MANITPSAAIQQGYGNAAYGAMVITWGPMRNGDIGLPAGIDTTAYANVTFQVEGTFGAAGSCAILGSNDQVNFRALKNLQGTTIAVIAAGITGVQEGVVKSVPSITAGDGTTSLTITAFYRRTY